MEGDKKLANESILFLIQLEPWRGWLEILNEIYERIYLGATAKIVPI